MIDFLQTPKSRNETLFYFGLLNLLLASIFILLSKTTDTQVNQVSAWHKPFKFALSIGIYVWTMAWYCSYLTNFNINIFNWTIILLLGFEIIYIAVQAQRGQLSHFNTSTPFYSMMYVLMAIAASAVSFYTAYICILFFKNDFPTLPLQYVWAIRLGLLIFVVFSFEGFLMGSRLSHTIGGADGGPGIPILNWSTKFGDLRIAHFIGMHALQVLPILSFYYLKNTKIIFILAILYFILASFTLYQAMRGKPLFKAKETKSEFKI